MKTSENGIQVLHYFEQCKFKAYPDPGSPLAKAIQTKRKSAGLSGAPWTIGYGDTGPDVVEGLVITQAEADARFAKRLAREFEPGVESAVNHDPAQCQFDALVCLAYNIGLTALRASTLMRLFNDGENDVAADQFLVWNRARGEVMLGLRRRRAAERALFKGSTGTQAIAIGAAIK